MHDGGYADRLWRRSRSRHGDERGRTNTWPTARRADAGDRAHLPRLRWVMKCVDSVPQVS